MARPKIAILYDFDKTLCTKDMQEYDFIKNLGMTAEEFWGEAGKVATESKMDKILAYMYVMVLECKKKGIKLTKEYLNSCASNIEFYKGVTTWFERINEYGKEAGADIEHYILSSGNSEIIEGSSIAKYFKEIYGCKFVFDENGEACWPGVEINYTLKTQFIHRVSKNVLDITNDYDLNKHKSTRRIPFQNMIYVGDGQTDVPCMKFIKEKGGKTIALYPSTNEKSSVLDLIMDNRVNFACLADYSNGSTFDKSVKLIIDNIVNISTLKEKEEKQIEKLKKSMENVDEN